MELSKNFEPRNIEEKWYAHWMKKGYFKSKPDEREPYTIVMPPPNVTGVLHMGHCLNNSIQDILIRRARMEGKNACWVPGTDHASIATEAKVVGMLRERGITKSSLSRDEFLGYAWEWKEKYGGIILEQLKKMGCSLDWDRTSFTMDRDYYNSVIKIFVDLYNKGMIYRGKRMINWDVKAKTALSDEEVIRKETKQKLYYLKYEIAADEGEEKDRVSEQTTSKQYITIATVRPETIMGDTAVAVNPADERYKDLVGKYAVVPLINRRIPIIADEYVTTDFGTGALKVTPAHDINDFQLGTKHGLEVIDVFNDDGTMSEAAQLYIGEDRFAVRKKVAIELEEKGFVEKTEEYASEVGYSERTDVVVEPRLSLQWWVKMDQLATPALRAVMDEEIKFYPPKFKNLYRHWMENIKDWCISRQLWWGHRIPAWYDEEGNVFIAENIEALHESQPATKNKKLFQDEDCLDTWFSSWLWPIEVFRGYSNPKNSEIQYYYPTQTLVTAPEIIFFWVARMIMAGFEWQQAKPFEAVYFTGIVRDKQGRKMSKSLGNSPDLLALIDQYGADAVRFGIMIASPAGNDILFDESALEQGRNFNNKIWNALKLVRMWKEKTVVEREGMVENIATAWFSNRLAETSVEVDKLLKQFRLSEALKVIYSLIWDDFCSWYLEWVKPGFDENISSAVYENTVDYFSQLMTLLHPFMPFITEEIYHLLKERQSDLVVSQITIAADADAEILLLGELLKQLITAVRDVRNKNNIKPKERIRLFIQTDDEAEIESIKSFLAKQVNAEIHFTTTAIPETINFIIGKNKFFIETDQPLDIEGQRTALEKEKAHLINFLASVEKKLGNDKFVQNARPEVLLLEQKKKADAEGKLKVIEESLR